MVDVVGAGPAGLAAAISLARAGRAVRLFERKNDCGTRFLGDLQALENWSDRHDVVDELRTQGVGINFDCAPVWSVIETNASRTETLRFDRPAVYLVRRGLHSDSLDQGLKRQAQELGVDLRFGETVPLETADIVATGPVSRQIFAVAKGMVFHTDSADLAVSMINDRAAPRGYAYLLISKGYGCLCTVLFEHFHTARSCFEEARRLLTAQFEVHIEDAHGIGGVGHFSREHTFERDGVRYVGEAAGLQDLLWGFGLRTAMRSGFLAAQSVIDGTSYGAEAHRHFHNQLKAGIVNRFLFEQMRFRDYDLVLSAFKANSLGLLYSLYRYHPLQRLLYWPALLHVRKRYPNLRV